MMGISANYHLMPESSTFIFITSFHPTVSFLKKRSRADSFVHYLRSLFDFSEQARARVSPFSRDTPLHFAVRQRSPEVLSLLLAAGAQVDALNGHGQTALHLAAENGRKDIAEMLLKEGAPVEIVDLRKMSPLAVAVQNDQLHIVRLLVRFGYDIKIMIAHLLILF